MLQSLRNFPNRLKDIGYARNAAAVAIGINLFAYLLIGLSAVTFLESDDRTLSTGLIQLVVGIGVPSGVYLYRTVRINQVGRKAKPKENTLAPGCFAFLVLICVALFFWMIYMGFFHGTIEVEPVPMHDAQAETKVKYPFGQAASWVGVIFAATMTFVLGLDVFNTTASPKDVVS